MKHKNYSLWHVDSRDRPIMMLDIGHQHIGGNL